jgi:hypothetical protein
LRVEAGSPHLSERDLRSKEVALLDRSSEASGSIRMPSPGKSSPEAGGQGLRKREGEEAAMERVAEALACSRAKGFAFGMTPSLCRS